jgi:hypothetical protein
VVLVRTVALSTLVEGENAAKSALARGSHVHVHLPNAFAGADVTAIPTAALPTPPSGSVYDVERVVERRGTSAAVKLSYVSSSGMDGRFIGAVRAGGSFTGITLTDTMAAAAGRPEPPPPPLVDAF